MSARAASRLERLGFTVYRYQAGKADWFAAGLPREGHDAGIPRLGDVPTGDIPPARLEDRVGEGRDRAALDAPEPLIFVDYVRVGLGAVTPERLNVEPACTLD